MNMICDRSGIAALEFALIAPVMVGLLLPITDYGLAVMRYISAYNALRAVGAYALYHPPPDLANLVGYLAGQLPPNTTVEICGQTLPDPITNVCAMPASPPRSFLFKTTITITPMIEQFSVGCESGCVVTYLQPFQ